jgi:hypothetical protein
MAWRLHGPGAERPRALDTGNRANPSHKRALGYATLRHALLLVLLILID